MSISDRDFRARLPGPVTGRPLRPLSIRASTASCSILFSFLTIISGAPSSRSLFRRLFLLMILLYRSFRSDVAKRPPSSCTMGRRSGGMTGIVSMIIQAGEFPDSRKASMTSSRLITRALFWPVAVSICLESSSYSPLTSTSRRSFLTASAPMPTLNLLPNFSLAS